MPSPPRTRTPGLDYRRCAFPRCTRVIVCTPTPGDEYCREHYHVVRVTRGIPARGQRCTACGGGGHNKRSPNCPERRR